MILNYIMIGGLARHLLIAKQHLGEIYRVL